MPPEANESLHSRKARQECKEQVRKAIVESMLQATKTVAIDEAALDAFIEKFKPPFSRILTEQKGEGRWKHYGPHVLYLSRLIGSLAQFYALRNPLHPETVGTTHLEYAKSIVSKHCDLGRDEEDEQSYVFCGDF